MAQLRCALARRALRARVCICTARRRSGRSSGACRVSSSMALAPVRLLGGGQRQLDEARAGQEDELHDGVVGEPGVALQREAAGEQPALARRRPAPRRRRAAGARPRTARRARVSPPPALPREPVALALEGVGGELHALCARGPAKSGCPVDLPRRGRAGSAEAAHQRPAARDAAADAGCSRAGPSLLVLPLRHCAAIALRVAVGAELEEAASPPRRSRKRTPSAKRTVSRTWRAQ